MKHFGTIEIVLGMLLFAYSVYLMLSSVLMPEFDHHGFLMAFGMFGSCAGALLVLAGVVVRLRPRWWLVAHIPLLVLYVAVSVALSPS